MDTGPASKSGDSASGLTLVELLLVVAIIAVLAAVAMPVYSGYRERVKQAQAAQAIAAMSAVIQSHRINSGSYPDTLAEVGQSDVLDPWGRRYVYVNLTNVKGKGKARKDRKLNPINSDFDLYSLGKDGVSKPQLSNKESLDDVVRANDGAYIGLAANFTR